MKTLTAVTNKVVSPTSDESDNLKMTFLRAVIWLVIWLVAIYFLVMLARLHWPKILASLYPESLLEEEEKINSEVAAYVVSPTATPTMSATISAALLNDLLQAILAASPAAREISTASASATPSAQRL
jgi:hypothetical protein